MADVPKDACIYVAGHRGLVGSAILRRLRTEGFANVVVRTRSELDLRDQAAVRTFFREAGPDYVFLAAGRVGGILANDAHPADFLYDNVMIAANVIHASHEIGVAKLLNLGSSCAYPKHAPQPMREEHLFTGPLEPTNRAYAVAKLAAIEMCDSYRRQFGNDFISLMPSNVYGPYDDFDLQSGHVLAALVRKFHRAKELAEPAVTVWGTGTPRREFLHADDLAEACLFAMSHVSAAGPINVGVGKDVSIAELAGIVGDVVGYEGRISFDTGKPDGTPRKLLDVGLLESRGWRPRIGLREGIEDTYRWYLDNVAVA